MNVWTLVVSAGIIYRISNTNAFPLLALDTKNKRSNTIFKNFSMFDREFVIEVMLLGRGYIQKDDINYYIILYI